MFQLTVLTSVIVILLHYSLANSHGYSNQMREEEYDYIVVGGGSAGSVVASRLSETKATTVLLLEAGGVPNGLTEIPLFVFQHIGTGLDWAYETVPQENACLGLKDKKCPYPRGKALGGSNTINSQLWVRGNRKDYDAWEKMGAKGWGWEDIKKYFKKIENPPEPNDDKGTHKDKGYLTISNVTYGTPLRDALLEAGKYLGYETIQNSDENQLGFSKVESNTKDGRRFGTEKGYLRPAARRENLDVLIHAHVTKMLFDEQKRARSVQFEHNNVSLVVSAKKEIILSGGVFGSAQLLMLSGIGPKKHLEELGIPVISDLPVGENLQDHFSSGGVTYQFKSDVGLTVTVPPSFLNPDMIGSFLEGKGPLTVPVAIEVMAYLNSKYQPAEENWPDVQIYVLSAVVVPRPDIPEQAAYLDKKGITLQAMVRRPKGRGFMKLRSKNPHEHPHIDPRYFSEEDDLKIVMEGIRLSRAIMETPSMQAFGPVPITDLFPECEGDLDSDEYMSCMSRSATFSNMHMVGTCKMGDSQDPTTVVDPELRVKGVKGLRVVDASVMPLVTSGNTNAPSILIGEKAADMIRGL